jgi:hypothetical protein
LLLLLLLLTLHFLPNGLRAFQQDEAFITTTTITSCGGHC